MRRFKSEEWLVLAETEIGYHEGTHSSRLGVYSQLGHKLIVSAEGGTIEAKRVMSL